MIAQIAGIVFPVFALVAVGYGYARWYLSSGQSGMTSGMAPGMAVINRVNLDLFVPALIFSVMSSRDVQLGTYSELALAACLVVLGSGLIAWPVARLLGYQVRTFLPPVMFNNSGNMGLPLALLAFGEAGLPGAVVLFVVENTLHFTLGVWLLAHRPHPLRLVRTPMLAATLLGIGFNAAGLGLPGPAADAVEMLGQVAIPLMLFALGVRMTEVDLTHWRIGMVGTLVYPVAGLACAAAGQALLGLEGMQAAQLVVFSVLPPAVLNYMLAEKYGQEPEKVASLVLLGTLSSLVVIPVALYYVL